MSQDDPHIIYVELRRGHIMPVFMGEWSYWDWRNYNLLQFKDAGEEVGWHLTDDFRDFLCKSKFEQRRGNTTSYWTRAEAALNAMRFTKEEAVQFKFLFDSGA